MSSHIIYNLFNYKNYLVSATGCRFGWGVGDFYLRMLAHF